MIEAVADIQSTHAVQEIVARMSYFIIGGVTLQRDIDASPYSKDYYRVHELSMNTYGLPEGPDMPPILTREFTPLSLEELTEERILIRAKAMLRETVYILSEHEVGAEAANTLFVMASVNLKAKPPKGVQSPNRFAGHVGKIANPYSPTGRIGDSYDFYMKKPARTERIKISAIKEMFNI